MNVQSCPFGTAYRHDLGLDVPLYHLIGNRIGVHLSDPNPAEPTGRRLGISVSAFEGRGINRGVLHLAPLNGAKMTLIEDIVAQEKHRKFPVIMERRTERGLVDMKLYYPASNEVWDFKIHLDHVDTMEDPNAILVREETLHSPGGWVNWALINRTDYTKDGRMPTRKST